MSFASWGNALYSGKRSYNFIGNRTKLLYAGLTVIVFCLLAIFGLGLEQSIDFKGGTQITVSGVESSNRGPANEVAAKSNLDEAKVTSLGTSSVRLQTNTLSSDKVEKLSSDLAQAYQVKTDQIATTTIGPTWGKDVTNKAIMSLIIFFVLVGLMLSAYFRTWTMAFAALFALVHDVLVTAGVLAIGRVEISPATIIGVLTILGYSLYDTVVVFDKVRELTVEYHNQRRSTYGELVNLAINQTLVRSINTSVVALLPVTCILGIAGFALGGGTLRDISLALFVGMIAGTLSSILIAPATLVLLRERNQKIAAHTKSVQEYRERKVEAGEEDPQSAQVAKPLRTGQHLGQSAQPKRKSRSKR